MIDTGGFTFIGTVFAFQPYGDSDYDWLDIERNRTLGAGYYFYSYRRLFGVIELSQDSKSKLTEKAGREGFRENRAYRQLRSILMNFFLQTAGDFFREEGKYAEVHTEKKGELNRNEKIRLTNSKKAKHKTAAFRKSLTKTFGLIDEAKTELEVEKIMSRLPPDVDRLVARRLPDKRKAMELLIYERNLRKNLHSLRSTLVVAKPRGVGLSRALANEWRSYLDQMKRLDSEVFKPSEEKIELYVSEAARTAEVPLDDITRLNSAVSEFKDGTLTKMRRLRGEINNLSTTIGKAVKEQTSISAKAVSQAVDEVMAELDRAQRTGKGIKDFSTIRAEFIERIVAAYDVEMLKMVRLHDQLMEVERIWEEDKLRYDGIDGSSGGRT